MQGCLPPQKIWKKYKPIIVNKSRNAITFASHHGIDINDIMQEGYIGLDKAIKSFSQNENASFYTFASICIDRQIVNYIKKMTSSKSKSLNEAINIDDNLESFISDGTDLENYLVLKDSGDNLIQDIKDILTDFERKVFILKLEDYSFDEIAKLLNKDVKSIYNTFHRIKTKIKKNIKLDN